MRRVCSKEGVEGHAEDIYGAGAGTGRAFPAPMKVRQDTCELIMIIEIGYVNRGEIVT